MKTKFQSTIETITASSIPMHMPGHKRNVAMLGDVGNLYFYIRKQDLAERNFDKVWLVLQCG